MTSDPRAWLPVEIAGHPLLRAMLSEATNAWSEHWFAKAHARIDAVHGTAATLVGSGSGWRWQRYRGSVCVCLAGAGIGSVASLLLDAGWESSQLSFADKHIVEALEATLLADLCERIELALGSSSVPPAAATSVEEPLAPDGGAVVEIKDSRGALILRATVPLALLATALRQAMPKPASRGRTVSPRLAALGNTRVRAEAKLGSVDLTLSELRNLGVGDVLVLNTKLDGPAVLTLDGMARPLALGQVSNTDGRLSLTLQA